MGWRPRVCRSTVNKKWLPAGLNSIKAASEIKRAECANRSAARFNVELQAMAAKARSLAKPQAVEKIVNLIEGVARQ